MRKTIVILSAIALCAVAQAAPNIPAANDNSQLTAGAFVHVGNFFRYIFKRSGADSAVSVFT